MKVYSLDINIDVYGSDQNRANPLLKVTGALNNVNVSINNVLIALFRH